MTGRTEKTESGGRRKPVRQEKWVDISNAPLARGDLLKIWNEAQEVKRTFQVLDITENEDGTSRLIKGQVVDTTDPNEQIGVEVEFWLPRAQPILGAHIKVDERFERLSGVEANDLMAVELYKWLMARTLYNYGAEFKKCVEFLKGAGFIPKGEDYQIAQNRVRAMMRQRGEMFRSVGGKIFGTGVDLSQNLQGKSLDGRGNVIVIRRIKLSKLYMGIRLVLESGIFGDVILEE